MTELNANGRVQARGTPPKSGANSATARNNTHSLSCRSDKAVTKQLIGQRLVDARTLNGYGQMEAATKLGYAGSAQLSQWEQARRMVPLDALIHCSRVYRVSLDYLVGLSDDPDRDPISAERQMLLSSAGNMLDNMAQKLADAVIYQTNLGGPTLQAAHLIVHELERHLAALGKFIDKNRDAFEEMPAGAPVISSATNLEDCLVKVRSLLERNRRINDAAMQGVVKPVRPHDNHPLFESSAND